MRYDVLLSSRSRIHVKLHLLLIPVDLYFALVDLWSIRPHSIRGKLTFTCSISVYKDLFQIKYRSPCDINILGKVSLPRFPEGYFVHVDLARVKVFLSVKCLLKGTSIHIFGLSKNVNPSQIECQNFHGLVVYITFGAQHKPS